MQVNFWGFLRSACEIRRPPTLCRSIFGVPLRSTCEIWVRLHYASEVWVRLRHTGQSLWSVHAMQVEIEIRLRHAGKLAVRPRSRGEICGLSTLYR